MVEGATSWLAVNLLFLRQTSTALPKDLSLPKFVLNLRGQRLLDSYFGKSCPTFCYTFLDFWTFVTLCVHIIFDIILALILSFMLGKLMPHNNTILSII